MDTKKIAIDAILPIATNKNRRKDNTIFADGNDELDFDKKYFGCQYQKCYQSFKEKPRTMLQVAHDTGIERASICRYVAEMRKRDVIYLITKGICPITKRAAGFYSTDEYLLTETDEGHVFTCDLKRDPEMSQLVMGVAKMSKTDELCKIIPLQT